MDVRFIEQSVEDMQCDALVIGCFCASSKRCSASPLRGERPARF